MERRHERAPAVRVLVLCDLQQVDIESAVRVDERYDLLCLFSDLINGNDQPNATLPQVLLNLALERLNALIRVLQEVSEHFVEGLVAIGTHAPVRLEELLGSLLDLVDRPF